MRVTIIPADGTVIKDNVAYTELTFTLNEPNIHAVQWYDTFGEVELMDARGRIVENRAITDLSPYQSALTAWQDRHDNPPPPIPQPQ